MRRGACLTGEIFLNQRGPAELESATQRLVTLGLRPALRALAHRSPIPVNLQVQVAGRVPDPVEIAAYYVVCEALVNTARHAHATAADVEVAAGEDVLRVSVRDDGRGGAAFGHGSGLVGLRDRVEALGGRILMDSPPGKGTTVEAHIPVQQGLPGRAATARSGK